MLSTWAGSKSQLNMQCTKLTKNRFHFVNTGKFLLSDEWWNLKKLPDPGQEMNDHILSDLTSNQKGFLYSDRKLCDINSQRYAIAITYSLPAQPASQLPGPKVSLWTELHCWTMISAASAYRTEYTTNKQHLLQHMCLVKKSQNKRICKCQKQH